MESAGLTKFTRILLTGPPGIGKTTVCKKIVSLLDCTKYNANGFYTEELRSTDKRRIGFDIVLWRNDYKKVPLARTQDHLENYRASRNRVGNYHVFVDEFERAVLPVLDLQSDVLLIDEIGKMELFSNKFQSHIEKLFFAEPKQKHCVIATIPQKHKVPQRFAILFEKLYTDAHCEIIEVDRQNRDCLPERLHRMACQILQ